MATVQEFLSLSDDLICILDEFGRVHQVNRNWKEVLRGEPLGVSLTELIEDEEAIRALFKFFNDSNKKMLRVQSCRIKGEHGKRLWVDLRIRRTPSQNKFWCLLRDISVRKFRNTVLEEIADACHLGNWHYRSSCDELICSEVVYEILQRNSFQHPLKIEDLRSFLSEKDRQALEIHMTQSFDFTCKAKVESGEKWIRLKGKKQFFEDGSFELYGILQDITREIEKDTAQYLSNIELSSFERGLDEFSIVARTDAKGKIIQANKAFCRISQYSESELIGKDHRIVNSGHHSKEFFTDMWKCIKEGRNWRGEIKNKAKDGSYYWVDTIIIPIRDTQGELVEVLSFRYEITALKKMQEKMDALVEHFNILTKANKTFVWSYHFKNHRFQWPSEMQKIFNCKEGASFEDVIKVMDAEDQKEITYFLADPLQTHFLRNLVINGEHFTFSLKAIRNQLGVVEELSGTCSKRQQELSPRKIVRVGA